MVRICLFRCPWVERDNDLSSSQLIRTPSAADIPKVDSMLTMEGAPS